MKRICVIFGTRPEAIKLAPVVHALNVRLQQGEPLEVRVCVTAQHRHMLDQVLELFTIATHYDLNIMHDGQDLTDISARVLTGLRDVFRDFKPDLVMVQGDTTTAFAASLASFYERIPVAHVEAGLRSGNIYSPWPEEMNRRLTGAIASLHFAPTDRARRNLLREGVDPSTIHVTGNTVIDALLAIAKRLAVEPSLRKSFEGRFAYLDSSKRLILVTGHRRENFGHGFENICRALEALSARDDVEIIYPVHLNPNVRDPVRRILSNHATIYLTEPLDYLSFVYLMNRAYLILTDSGGVQEEAPSLGKPVLVMRSTTERLEGIEAGLVKLVGTDERTIVAAANTLLDDPATYRRMATAVNPYGDGRAADHIAEILTKGKW